MECQKLRDERVHFKLLGKGGKVEASKKEEVGVSMASWREEVRAKLLARAEIAIDAMLEDERLGEKMTLSEIEQVIGQSEAEFRQGALEEIMARQQAGGSKCPLCGGSLENKGKRSRQVISVRGESRIERTYYQCQACGHGFFPPG
jgi:DNA repair exonuclease SbcCD ATPase subunit